MNLPILDIPCIRVDSYDKLSYTTQVNMTFRNLGMYDLLSRSDHSDSIKS